MTQMNTKCAFTIVAKNYIGLAMILGSSLKRHDRDVDFRIFVADEKSDDMPEVPGEVLFAKEVLAYTPAEWTDMSFKYDLTTFCTSIKPACFKYLITLGYEKLVYLDPDIFVFNSMSGIYNLLDEHSILLVPHIAGVHLDFKGEHSEETVLWEGTFNLGFCAIHADADSGRMLDWWEDRLKTQCFADITGSLFYDQKWMVLVPGFFDEKAVHVVRDLGVNMAPWNFFERKVQKGDDGSWRVGWRDGSGTADPLVFIHFAGYDYRALSEGKVERLRLYLKEYDDISEVLSEYQDVLVAGKEDLCRFLNLTYTYNYYDNGDEVEKYHRKLYDGLIKQGRRIEHPFSASQGSYWAALKRHGMISKRQVKVDKYSDATYPTYSRDKSLMNRMFKWAFRILGYDRFNLFTRALHNYAKPDHHFFLLENDRIEE